MHKIKRAIDTKLADLKARGLIEHGTNVYSDSNFETLLDHSNLKAVLYNIIINKIDHMGIHYSVNFIVVDRCTEDEGFINSSMSDIAAILKELYESVGNFRLDDTYDIETAVDKEDANDLVMITASLSIECV
jgi:hypothetical protein